MEKNYLQKLAQLMLDILFPRSCFGCKSPGMSLCDECIAALPPAPWNTDEPRGVKALFDYRDPVVKKVVWALKYKGNRHIASVCAGLLHDELIGSYEDALPHARDLKPLLVPVPMTWKRKRERGCNQGELLVKRIAALDDSRMLSAHTRALKKAHETPSQTSIKNRTERLKNIRDSFAVRRPKLVHGKHVIIIDDVYTTGGTLQEIMKVLKKAGAKKVEAVTIAH